MSIEQPTKKPTLVVVGLGLNAAAFTGELAIILFGRRSLDVYVVVAIASGLPLLSLHLAGMILGVIAKWRGHKNKVPAAGSSLAIVAGIFGLLVTTVLVLFAGLSGGAAWH
jgi:hypothetical protein